MTELVILAKEKNLQSTPEVLSSYVLDPLTEIAEHPEPGKGNVAAQALNLAPGVRMRGRPPKTMESHI